MVKHYFESLNSIQSTYPNYTPSQKEKFVIHGGRTYKKAGTEIVENHKISLFFLQNLPDHNDNHLQYDHHLQFQAQKVRPDYQTLMKILDNSQQALIPQISLPITYIQRFAKEQSDQEILQEIKPWLKELETTNEAEHIKDIKDKIDQYLNLNEHSELKNQILYLVMQDLFNEHIPSLKNLSLPNVPFIIMFSGSWGMGKTYTSKKLEEHFKGIRINTDDLRILMDKKGFIINSISMKIMIELYGFYCVNQLHQTSPNHMIILDRTFATGTYDCYTNFAQQYKYTLYFIRLFAERSVVEQRIKGRENKVHSTEWFLNNFDENWKKYEQNGKTGKFDYTLDNSQQDDQAALELIDTIKKMISLKVHINDLGSSSLK